MGETITETVLRFWKQPGLKAFYEAVQKISEQRRLVEAVYGASQLALRKPGALQRCEIPSNVLSCAEHILLYEKHLLDQYKSQYPLIDRWIAEIPIRLHGVTQCGDSTIAGEYGEDRARLFLLTEERSTVCDYYDREPGVRHIHFVHALDERRFLVSTGDSKRVLDVWRIADGHLRLERRLMSRLAGFTSVATLGGETYLGTDFSSRPNYLLRLSDRRKFFLPKEAFLKWIWLIEPVENRFLVIGSQALDPIGGARSVSIFDAALGCFVEPA